MIIRVKEKIFDPYARIPNRILNETKLSWKAKGILAYCMSKPEGWEIRIADLVNKSTDGETSVRSTIHELIENGYCQGTQIKNPDGSIGGYHYDFADYPYFQNPHVENPHVENHHHSNTEDSNTENNTKVLFKDTNKSYDKRPKSIPLNEIFAIFAKLRPDKKFKRQKNYGTTEKGMAKFYRENNKDTQCFYDLCDRLEESDYLMGRNGHEPPHQIKDPSLSWIFKQGNDGRLNAFGILEGKYSNENMAFVLERKKKESKELVLLMGYNEKQLVDLSDPKYKVIGHDDVQNIKKVVEIN